MRLLIDRLTGAPPDKSPVEIVERKGPGHPDTLCDRAAEELSIAFSKYYLERFGRILHHNVDKCVLVGGRSRTAYGGGEVVEPMELILVGRAVDRVDGVDLPVREIASETTANWLRGAMRYLDVHSHVVIESRIRPGSTELVTTFDKAGGVPLANDTSVGVGYGPLTRLEKLVLELDGCLASRTLKDEHPELGEDVKIMAVREGDEAFLTLAAAFVDRWVASPGDYLEKKKALAERLLSTARKSYGGKVGLSLNAADREEDGNFYLTVTGTSAESGDDGQVGRGNRVNGLITPCRPMVMEAAAGKNPVSHVGKLYNIAASMIASRLAAEDGVDEAQVFMVSRIGSPIDRPQTVYVRARSALAAAEVRRLAEKEVHNGLEGLAGLWREVMERRYGLF